jgi:glycosyltransferase involved in cell wall biosynthesis
MISVIIPTLNEEKLLPRMLGQFTPLRVATHNLEIIVSDGGSTDTTLSIARRYADKVVENPSGKKQNISIGRNAGAQVASGDVLLFLNADTLVDNIDGFLSRIPIEMKDPRIVALTCRVRIYPEEEIWQDRWFHGFYNWFFRMMNRAGMAMGRGECHIVRRQAFDQVGGYSGRIAAGEDYDLFRRLERTGKIIFLRDLTVFESPRRYRRYGYTYVTLSWFMNFLSVFFLRRSILSQWKPIR